MTKRFNRSLVAAVVILSGALLFVLRLRSGTNYYADPQNTTGLASDSNSGTSKGSPWLHAKGMAGCAGTCASTTLVAGDSMIVRGGTTIPNSYLPWVLPASGGSSGNLIYYGVDVTWFAGASFARPIVNQGNPVSTSMVASCTNDQHNVWAFSFNGANFVQLDNFEFTGHCSSGSSSNGGYVTRAGGQNDRTSNLYMHGMTLTTGASDDSDVMLNGNGGAMPTTQTGTEIDHNVLDNGDGTFGNVCTTPSCVQGVSVAETLVSIVGNGTTATATCTPNCGNIVVNAGALIAGNSQSGFNGIWSVTSTSGIPVTSFTFSNATNATGTGGTSTTIAATGFAIEGDCPNVHHTVIRHVSNGMECGNIFLAHDNLFEYQFDAGFGGRHSNVMEGLVGNAAVTCQFYNNITRFIHIGVTWWPQCNSVYIYNDVFEGSRFNPDQNCIMLSPVGSSNIGVVVTAFISNVTADGTCAAQAQAGNAGTPHWGAGSSITTVNLHVLDRTGVFTGTNFFTCNAPSVCTTTTDNGGNIFQTTPQANAQGYTISNDFQPTPGGATIRAGINASANCGVGGYTNDFCSGTSNGVLEQSGSGGQVVFYPAITINARGTGPGSPQSTWDAGAYQSASSGGGGGLGTLSGTGVLSGNANLQIIPVTIGFPGYFGSSTSLATITYPSTVPTAFQGLTGAGTAYTDPTWGACGVRLTDAAFDPGLAGNVNNNFAVSNGGSPDDLWWTIGDFLTLVTNSAGGRYLVGVNYNGNNPCPTAWTISRPYSSAVTGCPSRGGSCASSGGWLISGDVYFSLNSATPCVLYSLNGTSIQSYPFGSDVVPFSNPCPGTISGPPAATTVTNLIENSPAACVGTACNCLPSDFGSPTWTGVGETSINDTVHLNGWSSVAYHNGAGTGQNSGFYATVWSPTKGCMSYNTSTGVIQADTGWSGGSGLTCGGSQCSGTSTSGTTFTIHSLRLNKAGTVALITFEVCLSGSCGSNTISLVWVLGTTTVYPAQILHFGGHATFGSKGLVNNPGNPPGGFWYRLEPASGPSGTASQVNTVPSCGGNFGQQHPGWQMVDVNDSVPFAFTYTGNTGVASTSIELPYDQPTCPWLGEIDLADMNGDGFVHREGLCFTSAFFSSNFNSQGCTFEFSPSGNFVTFTSDGYGARNAAGTSTTCIPNGPDWLKSKVYATGYIINPNSNNAADSSFQATVGGTAATVAPNWGASCGSLGNTCTDGGVTWTNVGVPTGNNQCGNDAYALRAK